MSDESTLFKGSPSPVANLGTFALCGAVFVTALVASFVVPPPLNFLLWAAAGIALVYTNDASTPTLELTCIHGARELREEMRRSIELCRDRKRVRVAELE